MKYLVVIGCLFGCHSIQYGGVPTDQQNIEINQVVEEYIKVRGPLARDCIEERRNIKVNITNDEMHMRRYCRACGPHSCPENPKQGECHICAAGCLQLQTTGVFGAGDDHWTIIAWEDYYENRVIWHETLHWLGKCSQAPKGLDYHHEDTPRWQILDRLVAKELRGNPVRMYDKMRSDKGCYASPREILPWSL